MAGPHLPLADLGVPFVLVEGNADLTPAKLVGHHNPARVLKEDYSADNFVPGPLIQAMESGGFLYIEELNRAPLGYLWENHFVLGPRRAAKGPRQLVVDNASRTATPPTTSISTAPSRC